MEKIFKSFNLINIDLTKFNEEQLAIYERNFKYFSEFEKKKNLYLEEINAFEHIKIAKKLNSEEEIFDYLYDNKIDVKEIFDNKDIYFIDDKYYDLVLATLPLANKFINIIYQYPKEFAYLLTLEQLDESVGKYTFSTLMELMVFYVLYSDLKTTSNMDITSLMEQSLENGEDIYLLLDKCKLSLTITSFFEYFNSNAENTNDSESNTNTNTIELSVLYESLRDTLRNDI